MEPAPPREAPHRHEADARAGRSPVGQHALPAPPPARKVARPTALDLGQRAAALQRAADPIGAEQDVDRQPPPLELVRRALPREAPPPPPSRGGGHPEARGEGLERPPAGDGPLPPAPEPPPP